MGSGGISRPIHKGNSTRPHFPSVIESKNALMDKANLATVEKMWRREVEAATTYRHLANREHDQKRKDILLRLAAQEDKHADRWAERIAHATGRHPDRKDVERGLSWFQRISDPNV